MRLSRRKRCGRRTGRVEQKVEMLEDEEGRKERRTLRSALLDLRRPSLGFARDRGERRWRRYEVISAWKR